MPRDGSGNYTRPYPDVVSGTPIESAVYNGFTADVALDLNAARPIIAGGTGATTAAAALAALGGETAGQVVTNYDSHVFKAGSFYSSSATGQNAPVDGHAFIGIAYFSDVNNNLMIEARDANDTQNPRRKYVRHKQGGSWGSWFLDGLYGGGTATGDITISKPSPTFSLDKTLAAGSNDLAGKFNGTVRWRVMLGNNATESGGNTGSDFNITRYNDAGTLIDTPVAVSRATGAMTVTSPVLVNVATTTDALRIKDTTNNKTTFFRPNNGTLELVNNAYTVVTHQFGDAGAAIHRGDVTLGQGGTTGTLFFGNLGTKYLQYDGTNFNISGGSLLVNGSFMGGAATTTPTLDTTSIPTASIANGGNIVTIANFSGIVIVNNLSGGQIEIFICGGGAAARFGSASGSTSIAASYNAGANGYSFTNNSGSAATFGIMSFRTRAAA